MQMASVSEVTHDTTEKLTWGDVPKRGKSGLTDSSLCQEDLESIAPLLELWGS